MKKIKICGIRRAEDVEYINTYKPDYMGFIFADTRRYISPEDANTLSKSIDSSIVKVGVFVNADIDTIARIVADNTIDAIQLHGDEDEKYIFELRKKLDTVDDMNGLSSTSDNATDRIKLIKAVRVKNTDDIVNADSLDVDYLLLDTYRKGVYGGTGETFGWELIPDGLKHPYFLAGGIDENNLTNALKTNCYGVDISGGVETDGVKDGEKISRIISLVKRSRR